MKIRRKISTKDKKAVIQKTEQETFDPVRKSTFTTRFVYALIDPTTSQGFYVGLSEDPYERFITHLQCRDTNDAKNAHILRLKQRDQVPIMRILHRSKANLTQHHKIEAYYIDLFRVNRQPLTNQHLKIGFTLDDYEQALIDEVHFYVVKPPTFPQRLKTRIQAVRDKYKYAMERRQRQKELRLLKKILVKRNDFTIVNEYPRVLVVDHIPTGCRINLRSPQSLEEWLEYAATHRFLTVAEVEEQKEEA